MSDLDRLTAALSERYRVERELGRGGMATVYLAHDLRHDRKVALKVMRSELSAALGSDRFLREITLTAQLDHPHILPLLDSGEAAGLLYYAMPYVEGESLRERLRRERQLPQEDALRITREVADALGYAHAHGIVHRDVKPENILLASGHARVADFGIARAFSAAGGEALTQPGVSIGTPSYMSPEQAAGDRDVDARTDVYALACVLYEMLTGDPPFVASSVQMLVAKVISEPPPLVRRVRPSATPAVEAALSRALAKIPADRFATGLQFAEALHIAEGSGRPIEPASAAAGASAGGLSVGRSSTIVRLSSGRAFRAGAGVLLAAAVLGAGWWAITRVEEEPSIRSLVVLPLANLTADVEREYFVDGLHDALIGELAKISALRVISRTSTIGYKGTTKTVPQIAEELGVDAAVEGSVFWAGDTVRIQMQLIGARPERHVWSEAYERSLENVMGLLGEVAGTIAEQIEVRLTAREAGQLAAAPSVDREAQDRYLRGQQLRYRRDSPGVLRAIEEFRRAIRADPTYAAAHAALASAFAISLIFEYAPADSTHSWAAQSLFHSNRAIELEPDNAEAYAARGYLGLLAAAPADQVGRDLLRAIELKPSYAEVHGWYALHLAQLGRTPEALDAVGRALALDPIAPGTRLAEVNTARVADEYPLMLQSVRVLRDGNPEIELAWAWEGVALLVLGRAAECLMLERIPPVIEAMCLHSSGKVVEAEGRIAAVIASWDRGESPPITTSQLVWYHAWIGDVDGAVRWVERAHDGRPLGIGPGLARGVFGRVLDAEGGRFRMTVERLRREAWERIERESRAVQLP